MAMTNCPECGNRISTKAVTCPHCGYPLPEDAPFRTPPKPIDPSWTAHYDTIIRKRKMWHWIVFGLMLALFLLFLYFCLFDKRETYVYTYRFHSETKEEWLALSCVFGAFTAISLGFAIATSVRVRMYTETLCGYTVVVNIGLMLATLIVENRPFATFFRRTFFRKGFSAKLPDDTPYCVRYKNGRADFSFGSFDTEESSTDKITF